MKYEINESIKKKLLKLWMKDLPDYKKKRTISNIFFIITILFFLGFILLLTVATIVEPGSEMTVGIFALGVGSGSFSGLFPLMIGYSIRTKAKIEYGYPFNKKTQEVLYVFDEGIEFMYHDVDRDNPDSLDVYRIPVENIFGVGYDSKHGIITIIGKGSLTFYDDYFSRKINYRLRAGTIYNDSAYTFILGREDRDKIVEEIMDKVVKGGNDITLSSTVIVGGSIG